MQVNHLAAIYKNNFCYLRPYYFAYRQFRKKYKEKFAIFFIIII